MYEIQGRYYHNPDVIADLSVLSVNQEGPDRVQVSGFRGLPPPPTLKTAIQAFGGYQAEILVYAIGLDIEEKSASFEAMVRKDLLGENGGDNSKLLTLEVQLLGRCSPDPTSSNAATAVIRIFAQAPEEELLNRLNFEYRVVQNLGQAFPGFTPNLEYTRTGRPRPYLEYFPALLDRSRINVKVHWIDSQKVISVPHLKGPTTSPEASRQENYETASPVNTETFGPTIRIPLGYQVFARSGDKGANINVGLFPQGDSEAEWDWLRSTLTTHKLLQLLGDDARVVSRVERVEFPKLHCVHFVLFDILKGAVTGTTRPDSLGKVRMNHVPNLQVCARILTN